MPAPAILGSMALPALKLRRMVELSQSWQDAIRGMEKPTESPNRVFLRDAFGEYARPIAVISPGTIHSYQLSSGGDQNYFRQNGQLALFLAVDTPQEYYEDRPAAEFHATSIFGSVIDDIASIAGADDTASEDGTSHLSITSIQLQSWGENPEENWKSLGRFFYCLYTVDWGDGGGS